MKLMAYSLLLLSALSMSAQDHSCSLPEDLSLKWEKLGEELSSYEYFRSTERFKKDEERVKAERKAIAKGYLRWVRALRKAAVKQDPCCLRVPSDPVIQVSCWMTRFLQSGSRDAGNLASGLEGVKEPAQALGDIDEMGMEDYKSRTPMVFGARGAGTECADGLFRGAVKGDRAAARAYFYLYEDSSGELGEYMNLQVETIFLRYPKVALDNWPQVSRALEAIGPPSSEQERQKLLRRYGAQCASTPNPSCPDVLVYLGNKDQP